MEVNEKKLFNNICTVVLSVDDYTKFRKVYDPIEKQAEKYTKSKEVVEEAKTHSVILEGEDVVNRIRVLKTHLNGSSGSSQESKSIFGAMGSISSNFELLNKLESNNKNSKLEAAKTESIPSEDKNAHEESKEEAENSSGKPKEEIKQIQVVQHRVKKEAPKINMLQAISSFMEEIQPPSSERNSDDEDRGNRGFFGAMPPSPRPKILAKRKLGNNVPIKMNKLELIIGYTKILNANIFLRMLEYQDKEFLDTIAESELHTEKVFKMLTLLINQLYFENDKKTRKASDLYSKITRIFRSLASNPTTRKLLQRYVEEVVIHETF